MFKKPLFWILIFAVVTGCGGGKSSQNPSETPVAPTIISIRVAESLLPIPRAGERIGQNIYLAYEDLDADIHHLRVDTTLPDGSTKSVQHLFKVPAAKGAHTYSLVITDQFVPGKYVLQFQLVDQRNLESNKASVVFELGASAHRTIDITGVVPAEGAPGDHVVISGKGFLPGLDKNAVYFSNAHGSAEILAASETELKVIVPEESISGHIVVQNTAGRVHSPDPFRVSATIALTPTQTELITSGSVKFDCKVSGVADAVPMWSVSGGQGENVGKIDKFGVYSAPPSVPVPPLVTVSCRAGTATVLSAQANVLILAPVPAPNTALVTPTTGGQLISADQGVQLDISAHSINNNVEVSVHSVAVESVPELASDSYAVAAMEFEPSGLMFANPVAISFDLSNWEEPGTVLNLFVRTSPGGVFVDSGKTAIVDVSGLRATGAIDHFSVYAAIRVQAATQPPVLSRAQHFASQSSTFNDYRDALLRTGLLEGMTHPVLINRKSASSTNLGPFSAGLRVRASFDDPVFKTSALISIGPRSQFSADGWQLATTLKIPVIPGCDEGRLLDGTMVIDYPATSNSATLNIPFRVECLNELVVGRDSASSPLPAGVEEVVYQLSAGPKRVLMLRDRHKIYRFSRVDILAGGAVQVQDLARTIDDREPQQFWVTGDMTIEGSFDTNGKSGSPGGYGDNDFEAGGYGAAAGGGQYNAGSGGRGAPYTTNAPVLVQAHNDAIRRALCPLFPDFCPQAEIFMVSEITVYHGDPGPIARSGAVGGAGGKEWEAASAVTVAFEGARAVVSFATGDWIGAAEAAYGLIDESVKLLNNDKEMMASVGRGGGSVGASYDPRPDLAEFDFPRGGAGGGGAGAMTIAWPEGDESGGGGGAGGGGAPNLQLVVGGMLKILPGGMINGRGGYGGAGGRGGEYQAAPGGGGGGGRGAQIVIIAKGLDNKGVITTRGGLPGASGFISDGDEMGLVSTAFGKTGRNGAVRMQGSFLGSRPVDVTSYYVGPHIGRLNAEYFVSEDRFYNERPGDPNATVENGQWCPRVSLGYRPGSSSGSVFYVDPLLNSVALPRKIFETESGVQSREVCFPLQVGANRYAMRVNRENWNPGPDTPPGSIPTPGPFIEPHPWETQTVFYFPGLNDGDRDGLMDGAESFLGTNPQLADSDGDGLGDGYEIFQSHTDPKVSNFMQLTVSGVPGGVGQVSISPVGPWYTPNSSVTVSVLSGSSDYSFYQWRGDLTGNQNPATITMDKNKTIYAEFLYTQYTHPSGTLLPAKAVNTTTPTSSLGAPRVEMTAGGNAVIAWRQDNRIMARDFDATGGWGNTVDLGAAVNGQPQLATNIYGETILVWDHWDAANTRWQIYANRFNGEQRWHDPQLIAENAGKDINSPPTPLAATNDSLTVVLMWHVVSNDATSGVFTKRFETTTGWQTTKTINSPHGGEHQLALDNQGHAVLIWNVGGSVWARVLKKVGDYDQLIPAVRLSDAATSNNFDARVVLDRRNIIGNQGKATVVWAKGADIVSYRFAYKVDAIDSTGSRDVVDNRNTVAQTPHIVIDQRNNVLAVWKQGTDLWSNQYIEDWGHWLTPTLIEQNSAIPGEPRLRIDGYGNAMALWGQGGEIHLARYLAAQGWQPDNVIATPATNTVIDAPRLDLDQNGNAFALWRVWSESATTGEIALRYFSTSTTDTDGDGLTDAEEFVYYGTDAYAADTDGDTFSDGDEVTAGTDPLDKLSHP